MSDPATACRQVRPHLPELALGALDGRRRAEVLAHLDRCSSCSREAAGLARTADLLCELALPTSPPPRLARAVLSRGRTGGTPSRRRARQWVLVGAAAVLATAGLAVGRLALPSGGTPRTAGRPPAADRPGSVGGARRAPTATLTSALRAPSGALLGSVTVHAGRHPALVVWLRHPPPALVVECVAETRSGRRVVLGAYPTTSVTWSAPLTVRADQLASAELTSPSGALVARASLAW